MVAAPRVSGARRLVRGALASGAAVGSAAAAHLAAGHQGPHLLVVVLALAVSLPLCTALAAIRLGTLRLTASVLVSQAVLHGLFTVLPASAASSGVRFTGPGPHAGHDGSVVTQVPEGPTAAAPGGAEQALFAAGPAGSPDAAMLAAHLGAAVFVIALLHRGEMLLEAIADLFALRPVIILMTPREALFGVRGARPAPARPVQALEDLWAGRGPRTLRGPPVAT